MSRHLDWIAAHMHLIQAFRWWSSGPIFGPAKRIFGAISVTVGPWLLAIAALVFITRAMEHRLSAVALEDLRLTVVYAFMLAPIAATPLSTALVRCLSTNDKSREVAGSLIVTTCCVAGVLAFFLAVIFAIGLGLNNSDVTIGFIWLTSTSAMMWVALPALAALEARNRATFSFAAGMGVAMLLTVLSTKQAVSGAGLVWCFQIGVASCFILCIAPFSRAALDAERLSQARVLFARSLRTSWPFVLGALFALLAVWADKWVYWIGPYGLRSSAGFLHYPPYDGVMFLAHLSVLPALSALAVFQDRPLARAMSRLRSGINDGDALAELTRKKNALSATILEGLLRIFGAQLALSVGLILLSPSLVYSIGLGLDQLLVLRIGLLAATLHAFFLAACMVFSVCNARSTFVILQVLFFFMNFTLSWMVSRYIGMTALGIFGATAIVLFFAMPFAYFSLRNILRMTFLDGNDSLYSKV